MIKPFSGEKNIAYSKELNFTSANLYVSGPPHGAVKEVLEGTIDGERIIVKRNYGGPGVSLDTVTNDRSQYLNGMALAGKVPDCISYHSSASGNDLVFVCNETANAEVVYVK